MGKRPNSESSQNGSGSKRRRQDSIEDPESIFMLEQVADHADELISCLKSLQTWRRLGKKGPPVSRALVDALKNELSNPLAALRLVRDENGNTDGTIAEIEASIPKESKPPTTSPSVPSSAVQPWTASGIPQELPPLPKIKNATLEQQVFTHPGVSSHNYERLEWLGDAYLELIATAIIDRTFPSMPSGRCSQVREQLVRNITLARYFRDYHLDDNAILPPDLSRDMSAAQRAGRSGRSQDKDMVKTQGDMFEAYVAAVILDDEAHGLETCIRWLRDLWSMTIKDQIVRAERDAQTRAPASFAPAAYAETTTDGPAADAAEAPQKTVSPKEQLAKLIVVKGIDIKYKDIPGREKKDRNLGLPLFTVGVYLTGWGEDDKLLGWGTALNKKEAGQKAATRAMENKKQMKVYCQKKQESMAAAAAAAAEAGDGAEAGESGVAGDKD